MNKSTMLLLTILGMVTTSGAQTYNKPTYALGDTVEEVDTSTIQFLDMSIENMSFENAKSCKVTNVFELVDYYTEMEKFIPSLLGTKIHFQVTDDEWNYLDLHVYVDLQANFFAQGIINGRTFTRDLDTGLLYYDDSNEIVPNFDWQIR
jgi:hypothetical protein